MVNDRKSLIRMIQNLHESPDAKGKAIFEENRLSLSDPRLHEFLRAHHMQTDRRSALKEYLESASTHRVIAVIERFCNGNKKLAICEIGAGDGFLAFALIKAGFTNVDIVEPSSDSITGTGFLREINPEEQIVIYNDLESWYRSTKRYDILITNACIHHFQNPLFVILQVRLKSHLNTMWLAFNEFIAADYADTMTQLLNHRHATLYGLYEFPYSPHFYRQMFYYAGFKPLEIEPPLSYMQMMLRGNFCHLFILQKLSRLTSAFLRYFRMTWLIYDFVRFVVLHTQRDKIRAMDPFYMAYKAKPIGWAKVKPNLQFLQLRALGSRLNKHMNTSRAKNGPLI